MFTLATFITVVVTIIVLVLATWLHNIQHNVTQHYGTRYRVLCRIPLCSLPRRLSVKNEPLNVSVVMLNVIMVIVVMLNVVAPATAGLDNNAIQP